MMIRVLVRWKGDLRRLIADRGWWWLENSPADRNDYIKLELPRAWESSDNSGPLPDGKGKVA